MKISRLLTGGLCIIVPVLCSLTLIPGAPTFSVDVNAAGVLAQVISAMLLVVALDEKLSPSKVSDASLRSKLLAYREWVACTNMVALALCLFILVSKTESPLLSIFIIVPVTVMLVFMFALLAGHFGRTENEEVRTAESVDQ